MGLVFTGDLDTYRYGVWKMDAEQQDVGNVPPDFLVPEFKSAHRRTEFISVRRLALAMGVDPSDIDYTVSGKPLLRSLPETHISISHSRRYAAFMVSKQVYTGIDIEEFSERILRVRSRFMSEEEENKLRQLFAGQTYPAEAELIALYLHWCSKEAMYKALDIPSLDFKQDLKVDICGINGGDNSATGDNFLLGNFLKKIQGRFKACYTPKQIRFNIDFFIREDFVLTCCSSE